MKRAIRSRAIKSALRKNLPGNHFMVSTLAPERDHRRETIFVHWDGPALSQQVAKVLRELPFIGPGRYYPDAIGEVMISLDENGSRS